MNSEFTSLMKSIYTNVAKKYEDIVKNIVTDADLDHIDFPLIAVNFNIDKLSKLLPPDLVEKLGGLDEDDEIDSPENGGGSVKSKEKNEEFKEGELEDIEKAKMLSLKDQSEKATEAQTDND